MEKSTKKIKVDRIEENTIIAFTVDGEMITFKNEFATVRDGDICIATFDDSGVIISVTVLDEETQTKKDTLKSMLKKLFNKEV